MEPLLKRQTVDTKLVQYLDDQNKAVSLEQISRELALDRTTIKKHLQYIQTHLKRYFTTQQVTLRRRTAVGIVLVRRASISLASVLGVFKKDLIQTALITSTFDQTAHSLEEFAQQQFISLSTAKRKVGQLKSELTDFGLRYSAAHHTLVGNEAMIRLYYYWFYWQTYGTAKWPFEWIEQQRCLERVQSWLEQLGQTANPVELQQLCYWWVLCRQRQSQGAPVMVATPLWRARWGQRTIDQFPVVFVKQSVAENVFFSYAFLLFTTQSVKKKLEPTGLVAAANQTVSQHLSRDFKQQLSVEQRARFTQQLVRIHSFSGLFPVDNPLWTQSAIFQQLQRERPTTVQFSRQLVDQLTTEENLIFQQSHYLLMEYAPLIATYYQDSLLRPVIQVGILIDAPVVYQQRLVEQLKQLFASRYRLEISNQERCWDLVVTNLSLDLDCPTIAVSLPLSQRDRDNLQSFIKPE